MSAYDDYLAGKLSSDRLAAMANRTQSMGAAPTSELQSSPNYPGGVPASSSGPNFSAGLKALAAQQNQPQAAPPPMAPLTGPSFTPGSSTPSYAPANAPTPQMNSNLGMSAPLVTQGLYADPSAPQRGNALQSQPSIAQQLAQQLAQQSGQSSFNQPNSPAAQYGPPASMSQPYNVDPSASNAGVSSVPGFLPAPDIATHASLLARIAAGIGRAGQAVGHVVQQGISNYGTNLAGLSPQQLATMSPGEIHQAHMAAFNALANRVSNPEIDRNGFRQSPFAALAQGNIEGGEAAQGVVGQQQATAQRNAALLQQHNVITGRAQIAQQYAIQASDAPLVQLQKLTQAASASAAIGDEASAKSYTAAADAINKRGGMYGTPAEKAPPALEFKQGFGADGKPLMYGFDKATGALVSTQKMGAAEPKGPKEMTPDQQEKTGERIQKAFATVTPVKDYLNARSGYDLLRGALVDPNQFTSVALVDAYNRVVNPRGVVRKSMYDLVNSMGSVTDRVRRFASIASTGRWPDDLTQEVVKTVTNVMRQHQAAAMRERPRFMSQLNNANVENPETFLPDLSFDGDGGGAPASQGASANHRMPLTSH